MGERVKGSLCRRETAVCRDLSAKWSFICKFWIPVLLSIVSIFGSICPPLTYKLKKWIESKCKAIIANCELCSLVAKAGVVSLLMQSLTCLFYQLSSLGFSLCAWVDMRLKREKAQWECGVLRWKQQTQIRLCQLRQRVSKEAPSIFFNGHWSIISSSFFFMKRYLRKNRRVTELGRWRELWPERWLRVELVTYDACLEPSHSITGHILATVRETEVKDLLVLHEELTFMCFVLRGVMAIFCSTLTSKEWPAGRIKSCDD